MHKSNIAGLRQHRRTIVGVTVGILLFSVILVTIILNIFTLRMLTTSRDSGFFTMDDNGLKIGTNTIRISRFRLDMGNKKIVNLANPTASNDAATKGYVDAQASGGSGWDGSSFTLLGSVVWTGMDYTTKTVGFLPEEAKEIAWCVNSGTSTNCGVVFTGTGLATNPQSWKFTIVPITSGVAGSSTLIAVTTGTVIYMSIWSYSTPSTCVYIDPYYYYWTITLYVSTGNKGIHGKRSCYSVPDYSANHTLTVWYR